MVEADKGFNFSHVDDSFVCQKKNHFQVRQSVCSRGRGGKGGWRIGGEGEGGGGVGEGREEEWKGGRRSGREGGGGEGKEEGG